jgi:hypothetical protein
MRPSALVGPVWERPRLRETVGGEAPAAVYGVSLARLESVSPETGRRSPIAGAAKECAGRHADSPAGHKMTVHRRTSSSGQNGHLGHCD